MKRLFCLIALGCVPALAAAQPYAITQAPNLQPTIFGSLALADFDRDGDLDVLVTGSEPGRSVPVARIYRNDGRLPDDTWSLNDVQATFPDVARYLVGFRASSADVADFDNDGDLDVLLSGHRGTAVYRNEGQYRFTPIRIQDTFNRESSYFVDIVTAPSAAWGDYDADGDLDILLTGTSGSFIYRNDGYARFAQIDVGLPLLPNGIVAWADYDNDSDLDILAVSRPFREERPETRIFRNDGGRFTDARAVLPGIEAGSIRWGDYDGDGDLDVLVMSRLFSSDSERGTASGPGIYRNDRGVFSPSGDTLPRAWFGDWVDFDNDGDLDVLVNGLEGAGTYAQLIRNDDGRFRYRTPMFDGIWFGDIATGDLDGDGRVEILMNGRFQIGYLRQNQFLLYRNTSVAWSDPPRVPTSLASRREGDRLILSWRSPTADVEDGGSFTYNVRVGTTPGRTNVLAPMSDMNGRRLVAKEGNAGHNQTVVLTGLRPDVAYYWSVQSVDHRRIGSAFARERVALASPMPVPPSMEPVVTENYPNPFNPSTTIHFTLASPTRARVVVYNVLGSEIAVLTDGVIGAGTHEAIWNGTDRAGRPVPSGVYLYAIQTPDVRVTRSMLLLK